MPEWMHKAEAVRRASPRIGLRRTSSGILLLLACMVCASCFSGEKGEAFYGRAPERLKPELRWSDGELPRVFDPALAAAAPDTDAVRAMFEGLTELDPKTLAVMPAVAERWRSSEADRVWTFELRTDARWSNGDRVTADDFVRSWRRAINLGERVPHGNLFANIKGALPISHKPNENVEAVNAAPAAGAARTEATPAADGSPLPASAHDAPRVQPNANASRVAPRESPVVDADRTTNDNEKSSGDAPANRTTLDAPPPPPASAQPSFGVEALAPDLLRVRLIEPDPEFPALVAHTVFRPLHETDSARAANPPGESSVPITNGAFNFASRSDSEIVLTRAATYWNVAAVRLEAVRFVFAPDTETKLAMYRAGDLDVVGNAAFEPLAIKLLAPHEDFRRRTFGALNYYVFNPATAEFADHRVREAFALAVDRERLVRDTLGGAGEPAYTFLPDAATTLAEDPGTKASLSEDTPSPLRLDRRRARQLLAEAGFPDGRGFPVVRLLVNRNETHKTIANVVAAMWRDALGVTVEVVIKDRRDFDLALASGDYTIARRGHVMQTPTERHIIDALFHLPPAPSSNIANEIVEAPTAAAAADDDLPSDGASPNAASSEEGQPKVASAIEPSTHHAVPEKPATRSRISSHVQALRELPGIPLYFASANTLVKPYVIDFDGNFLDAPSLKQVRIDTEWTPTDSEKTIDVKRR